MIYKKNFEKNLNYVKLFISYFLKLKTMAAQTKQITKKEEEKKVIELSASDKMEIEKSFAEAKDFREVGERITQPFDDIISETAEVIDNDPIMNVSEEL
jgi:hypothetical protein